MTAVAVAMTESARRAVRVGVRGVVGRVEAMDPDSPAADPPSTARLDGPGRGADGLGPPPRFRDTPAASSKPLRRSREISRQRPSTPNRRKDAGTNSYPAPADHEVHRLENEREWGDPIPPPRPATRYGPFPPPWNAVTSTPRPANAPSASPARRM
jgi:hypothetical protein